MIFIIILASIIGIVINILFWVWVYRLIVGFSSSSVPKSYGNYQNSDTGLYDTIEYDNLMTFMNSLQQLQGQIHSQTNNYSADKDFNKMYKLIQNSSKNANGGKINIDPKFNSQLLKMQNHMREFDQLSKMKSDVFQSNLTGMAASAGLDFYP